MSTIRYNLPVKPIPYNLYVGSLLRYIPGEYIVVDLTPEPMDLGDTIPPPATITAKVNTLLFKDLFRVILRDNMKIGDIFIQAFKGTNYWVEITEPEVIKGIYIFCMKGDDHRKRIMDAINDLSKKIDGILESDILKILNKIEIK